MILIDFSILGRNIDIVARAALWKSGLGAFYSVRNLTNVNSKLFPF